MAYRDNPAPRPKKVKAKPKKKTFTLPKKFHTETQTDKPRQPKLGPPTPKRLRGPVKQSQERERIKRDIPRGQRGDTHSDADRKVASDYWLKRAERAVAHGTSKPERHILEHMGLTRRRGFLVNRYDEEGPNFPGGAARVAARKKFSAMATGGAGQGVSTSGVKILEQSARGLHANAGALRGKNWWEEFKHGHDTGSDVLKSAGVKNKYARAVGGFLLDIPLSGGGVKATANAPARKLEQEAARAETKARQAAGAGKLNKADRLSRKVETKRAAAKTADKNRGVGVGVEARVPFTSKGVSKTVGEKTTAKIAKKAHVPQAAEKARTSRAGRVVGHSFAPNYREADVPKEFHEKHVELRRHKNAKDREADRLAARRGHAYEHVTAGHEEEILRGVERQPETPIVNVKARRRVHPAHKAVTSARRKVRSAELRVQRAQGRTDIDVPQQRRVTVQQTLNRIARAEERARKTVLADMPKRPESDKGKAMWDAEFEKRLAKVARGTNAAERHAGKVAAEYRAAASDRISASHDLAQARKGVRNSHESAPALYTDAEREDKLTALDDAQANLASAKARFATAEAELHRVAEHHAGRAARGIPSSQLKQYDRRRQFTIAKVEKTRGELQAARAELKSAQEKAKGIPRHEKTLYDVDRNLPVEESLKRLPRHDISSIPDARSRQAATVIRNDLDHLDDAQRAAGIYPEKTPDYFPHQTPPTDRQMFKFGRRGRAAKPSHALNREDPRDILSQNLSAPGKLDTNIGRRMAVYTSKAHKALNDAEYLSGLRDLGKKYTPKTTVGEDEALVEITGNRLRSMEDHGGKLDQKLISAADPDHLVVLPRSVAVDELVKRGPVDTKRLESMGQTWDRITGAWKTMVTVYNVPFYQQRNVMDDTLRFWMGDGNPVDWVRAAKLMRVLHGAEAAESKHLIPGDPLKMVKVKVAGHEVSGRDFIEQAMEDGAIRAGHYGGELEQLVNSGKAVGSRNPIARSTGALRSLGTNLEDIPRLATYKSALDRGMSRTDAAAWTRLHHFDYTELTDTEKGIRRLVPFYTFTSRNMQLQLRKLATKPGKFAVIEAFREEMAKLAGLPDDWQDKYLDETQKRAMAVPVRVGPKPDDVKLLYFGFSTTDLNRIPLPGQSADQVTRQQFDLFMQMVHPVPKGFMEYFGNHSFFFRGPIYRTQTETDAPHWVPAPTTFLSIPLPSEVKKALGYTTIKDPKTGKMIDAWPAKLDYFVRQLPQTGFAATLGTPGKNSRGQTTTDRIFSQATGVRMAGLDRTKGSADALRNRIGDLTAQLNDLRDKAKDTQYKYIWSDEKALLENQLKAAQDEYAKVTKKLTPVRTERPPETPKEAFQRAKAERKTFNPRQAFQEAQARAKAERAYLRTHRAP